MIGPLRAQRGLSLVESMVGLALGLLVVAFALTAQMIGFHETRRLAQEIRQVQQLRAGLGPIARSLRRAGHWQEAGEGVRQSASAGAVPANPNALDPTSPPFPPGPFRYRYDPAGQRAADRFGLRLRDATVDLEAGSGNWQALTDPAALEVTALRLEPTWRTVSLAPWCLVPCAASAADCPPRQRIVTYAVGLTGRVPNSGLPARDLRSAVRVRNDTVTGACGP